MSILFISDWPKNFLQMELVISFILSISTVPGTKLVADKFCWVLDRCIDGKMDGWEVLEAQLEGTEKKDWKGKRWDALGQWLMTFNLGREGLVLEALFKKLPSAK